MSRDLSTSVSNAIGDEVITPFFAIEMLFSSGTLRLWTGVGTMTISGQQWVGAGNLLNVSTVDETKEMAAKGATITLSGIPANSLALALTEPYQGRVCKIYFGIMGQDDLTELFSGYMDQMNIEDGGDTANISVNVENKLIDLERPRVARFNSGYQKSVYPDDKGFDFVEDLQDKTTPWGQSADS